MAAALSASPLRLVAYTDATVMGGAEQSLRDLLGALDPDIAVTVVGIDRIVVDDVVGRRPGTAGVVLAAVRDKRDLRPIGQHIRALRALRPDVVHVNLRTPFSCQYGLLAASLLPRVRIVAVEHAPIDSEKALQRLLRRVLNVRVDAHVAVSQTAAREVETAHGMAPGSVRVIYNGVEDLGAPAPRDSGRTVGYVGRLSPEKGVDVLVRALARLPGVTGLFVGDGPERERLAALARELGVSDRMRFTGWSDRPRSRLAEMDVLAVPSRRESLGLAAIEAMLAARPVVAADIGGVSEVIEDGITGQLVAPEDPTALASSIGALLDDPERARRMGAAGRERALLRFPTAGMVDAFEALYRER